MTRKGATLSLVIAHWDCNVQFGINPDFLRSEFVVVCCCRLVSDICLGVHGLPARVVCLFIARLAFGGHQARRYIAGRLALRTRRWGKCTHFDLHCRKRDFLYSRGRKEGRLFAQRLSLKGQSLGKKESSRLWTGNGSGLRFAQYIRDRAVRVSLQQGQPNALSDLLHVIRTHSGHIQHYSLLAIESCSCTCT